MVPWVKVLSPKIIDMMFTLRKAWTIAIEALSWVELSRITEGEAINKTTRQLKINDPETTRKAMTLVTETLKRKNFLDYIINQNLESENIQDFSIGVQSFLRLYTHLRAIEKIDEATAFDYVSHGEEILGKKMIDPVHEALDLIPYTDLDFTGFNRVKKIALTTYYPEWYVQYCLQNFGEQRTSGLLGAQEYPRYLRVNMLKADQSVVTNLREKGNTLSKVQSIDDLYQIQTDHFVTQTPEYQKGLYVIQDKSSVIAVQAASPEPGQTVLDVCAAPGLKTSFMAQLMKNEGKIYSIDYSESRMKSWIQVIRKLGVEIAEPLIRDATKKKSYPDIIADLVFIDPPCTGTGLFVRHPSSKWRISRRSIRRMASIQRQILEASSQFLKKEGRLVYCTCSITLEENEHLISDFLEKHPEYELTEMNPFTGSPGLEGMKHAQRLYPDIHNCNGFFIAKLVKH